MSITSITDDICVVGLIGCRRKNPAVFFDFQSACVARVLLHAKPAMLSRICAGWLVLLILLPFSAPFSTCDLTMFLGDGAPYPSGPVAQAAVAQHAATHALPHTRSPHRDQWRADDVDSLLAAAIRPVSRAPSSMTPPTLVSPPVLQPLRI